MLEDHPHSVNEVPPSKKTVSYAYQLTRVIRAGKASEIQIEEVTITLARKAASGTVWHECSTRTRLNFLGDAFIEKNFIQDGRRAPSRAQEQRSHSFG